MGLCPALFPLKRSLRLCFQTKHPPNTDSALGEGAHLVIFFFHTVTEGMKQLPEEGYTLKLQGPPQEEEAD